jgi:hypothetical protein
MDSSHNETMSANTPSIVTLNANNWKFWSAQIRPLLQMKGCHETTTVEAKPKVAISDEDWNLKRATATFFIKSTLSEDTLLRSTIWIHLFK